MFPISAEWNVPSVVLRFPATAYPVYLKLRTTANTSLTKFKISAKKFCFSPTIENPVINEKDVFGEEEYLQIEFSSVVKFIWICVVPIQINSRWFSRAS